MATASSKKKRLPRVLLIGTGHFGLQHLRVLKELDADKVINFAAIIVRGQKKRKNLEKESGIKCFGKITLSLLKKIDVVDIVTPSETHFSLVKKCIPHVHVFVEKPLATKNTEALMAEKLARKYGKILAVGHIFRHHPVAQKIKKIIGKKIPLKIYGTFLNPAYSDKNKDAPMELLHMFDLVDFIWNMSPTVVHRRDEKRTSLIDMRYAQTDAHFLLGWKGIEKERKFKIEYKTLKIEADFVSNVVSVVNKKNIKYYSCPITIEPLKIELKEFFQSLKNSSTSYTNGKTAARIIRVAERVDMKYISHIPLKVAIIGGGIFGVSIASELGKFCQVDLFEKNNEIMQEGSRINQYRHHNGYHYPRSDETVYDIQNSLKDFENKFKKAIMYPPTYYGLAKNDSLVTESDFFKFCHRHDLVYMKKFPPSDLLQRSELRSCIKVPEGSYNYKKLKKISEIGLRKDKIKVFYNTTVKSCKFSAKGKKIIRYKNKLGIKEKEFDFVINATYANINNLTTWLGLKPSPIRIDLAEVLIIKLPIKPISLTVIDGPFATLMPTGNKNEFTLYHVKESIIDRYVSQKGLIKKVYSTNSRNLSILRESTRLFPILKKALVVESRIVHRGVQAFREHDDARVSNIIDHGFGCWSILSGKILSSVSIAKKMRNILQLTLKNK